MSSSESALLPLSDFETATASASVTVAVAKAVVATEVILHPLCIGVSQSKEINAIISNNDKQPEPSQTATDPRVAHAILNAAIVKYTHDLGC
jgi:hypothetical protein